MKEMTYILTCDASDDCTAPVTDESVPLAFGGKSVTIDLCAQHYTDFMLVLSTALERGVPAEKKKRKSPTKKLVASKSAQTSVAITDAKLLNQVDPAPEPAAVDKSRVCVYCGETKRSNAGLAQHLRHKHSKTMAQHNTAEAKKNKEQK